MTHHVSPQTIRAHFGSETLHVPKARRSRLPQLDPPDQGPASTAVSPPVVTVRCRLYVRLGLVNGCEDSARVLECPWPLALRCRVVSCVPPGGEKHELGPSMVRIGFEPHEPVMLHFVHHPLHGLTRQPHVSRDMSDG